jgi:hypothetical protein
MSSLSIIQLSMTGILDSSHSASLSSITARVFSINRSASVSLIGSQK